MTSARKLPLDGVVLRIAPRRSRTRPWSRSAHRPSSLCGRIFRHKSHRFAFKTPAVCAI